MQKGIGKDFKCVSISYRIVSHFYKRIELLISYLHSGFQLEPQTRLSDVKEVLENVSLLLTALLRKVEVLNFILDAAPSSANQVCEESSYEDDADYCSAGDSKV